MADETPIAVPEADPVPETTEAAPAPAEDAAPAEVPAADPAPVDGPPTTGYPTVVAEIVTLEGDEYVKVTINDMQPFLVML